MKMPAINPTMRLSIGLVLFSLSVLLIADLLGVIPKKEVMLLESRKKVCESLAVQLSIAATRGNVDILSQTLESFVYRNKDVLAASLRRQSGEIVSEYGIFDEFTYEEDIRGLSSANLVFVPIYAGENHWGTVNVEFVSVFAKDWKAFFTDSVYGLLLFVALASLGGYILILRKALRVLDPKAIVPERVRTAFNTLAEGVLILDDKEQIMMANKSFADKIEKDPDKLLGYKASDLKWVRRRSDDDDLPWFDSIHNGARKINIALNLSTRASGVRSISANSAPIVDEEGKTRGALVTFDDITEVQETNLLLENAVNGLRKSDAEIRRKNQELKVLASRDPLTGCYNRRAFFDILEDLYDKAVGTNGNLACIMLDIDHFKSINDTYGHSVGDEVIRMVSEILNSCPYEGAAVGRYGGEEFCVILPDANTDAGKTVAEGLRKKITKTARDLKGIERDITASFGVSCLDTAMESFSQLLEQADTALYTAKHSGRDRVVTWVEHTTLEFDFRKDTPEKARSGKGPDISAETEENRSNIQFQLLKKRVKELETALDNVKSRENISRFRDPVTELPSHIIFEDRVSQAMAYSDRKQNMMAIAILNIDMFSRINNSLGQVVGDEFLKAVGRRLQTILRRSDTVAAMISPDQSAPSVSRLHDDEFALLLTGLDSVESLSYVIKRVQEKFAGKISVGTNQLYVTTTIGLSVYPHDGKSARDLIDNARSAQKHAKTMPGRNNYQFFSEEINRKIIEQMKLELDIHKAVDQDNFEIYYQPKLNIDEGRIDSMEALVRWRHPERGMVPPGDFIETAEKSGMILDIGARCLEQVCQQLKTWLDQGALDLRVSVNISVIEFMEDGFAQRIKRTLRQSGLPAHHLELEITESTIMNDLEKSLQIIEELRLVGVTITLDDFGTGYSSFHYLGRLDFDWIKIDRYFLTDAMQHKRSRTLYSGIVTMAHEIGLKVVSEGIETQEEYNYVNGLGVNEMQGYMLSKPLSADAVQRVLFSKYAAPKTSAVRIQ